MSGGSLFFLLLLLLASPGPAAARAPRSDVSPTDLLEQALEAYLQQKYDESVALFEQVLQWDKKNPTAREGLKSALRQREIQVEKLRAQEKPALQACENFLRRQDWVEAIDRLRSVLERVPDHPKARSLAEKIRKQVTKLHKKAKYQSSDWFYTKGVLAYLDGDWFQAVHTWEQVYAFDPDRISLLAKINMAKQNLEEQQRLERIALYKNVAWDNLRQRRYEDAVKAWQDLLNVDPGNLEAQEGLRQTQEAAAQDLVRRRQQEVQNLSQRAMDAYIERDYKRSLALWKELLEFDPDSTLARDYVQRIQGRDRTASYRYEGYSSSSYTPPAPVSSGYQRALEFLREERYPEAIEALERYVNKNPDEERAKRTLEETRKKQKGLAEKSYKDGLVSYSQGKPSEAIRQWQETLRIDPDYQKARQALIKAMAESKRQ